MATLTSAPQGTSCPTCGAHALRGQLVCLECGSRVSLRYRRPPRWQLPVGVTVLLVLLAVAGLFATLREITRDAENEVAAGPAAKQERGDRAEGAATTTSPTPDRAREPAAAPPARERPAPADDALASAKKVETAVLSGSPAPGIAKSTGERLSRGGFEIGTVTNSPQPEGTSYVMFRRGSAKEARALAKRLGIRSVRRVDRATNALARSAKLFVVVGADR